MPPPAEHSRREPPTRTLAGTRSTGDCAIEVLESTLVGLVGIDASWRYLYVNRAAEELAGLPRGEMLGRTVWDVHPQLDPGVADAYRRAMSHRHVVSIEQHDMVLDLWREVAAYPAPDGIVVCTRDVTNRKRREERLRERECFIRLLTDVSPVVLDVFDVQMERHNYFSRNIVNLIGYTPEELTGMPDVLAVVHPDDLPAVRKNIERLQRLHDGEISEFECRVRRRDGQWRWILSRSGVLARDASGAVERLVSACFDVTDRRHGSRAALGGRDEVGNSTGVEDTELLRRTIAAQEDERRRIAREMHDALGQELTALTLKVAAVKRSRPTDSSLAEQLESIGEIVHRLDADIDLLIWQLRPRALQKDDLSEAVSAYVSEWSAHSGIRVQLYVRGLETGRLAGEIEITVYRIVQEALNNVAKHSTASLASVIMERRTKELTVIIEDDGVGFDVEQRGGTQALGLGLVGVRERAALVNGEVALESRPGHGTTLAVRIPLAESSKAAG